MKETCDCRFPINPLGPSGRAKTAIRRLARKVDRYPGEHLERFLRYVSHREGVPRECVVAAPGTTSLVEAVIRMGGVGLLAVPAPLFSGRLPILERCDVTVSLVRQGAAGEGSARALIKALSRAGALLLPLPHDVTGQLPGADEVAAVMDHASSAGKTVIIDGSLADFADYHLPVDRAVATPGAVILRGFSAFHALAGLRVAYAVGYPPLVEGLRNLGLEAGIGSVALDAARASMGDKGFVLRSRAFVAEEKAFIAKGLKDVEGVAVSETPCNFLLLRFEMKEPDLTGFFRREGMRFETWPEPPGTTMRFPVLRRRENARIVRLIRKAVKVSHGSA